MTDTETLERVREIFRGDRFATETGAVIDDIGDLLTAARGIDGNGHIL